MGCKPCPHHCPRGPGAFLAVLGLAVAVVLAVVVGRVVESLFVALMVTGSVLGAAGIGLFAYLIRRDRWSAAEPREPAAPRVVVRVIPARSTQAISAPRRSAAALPAPTANRRVITAAAAELENGADVGPQVAAPRVAIAKRRVGPGRPRRRG